MRKIIGSLFFGLFMGFSVLATAGTVHRVPLSQYKQFNVIGVLSFGGKLPAVGSYILTPSQGADLQYIKKTGQYRIAMNNYMHRYVNLKHSASGWYMPISHKTGVKLRTLMGEVHKCHQSPMGNPCAVQLMNGPHTMDWSIRHIPYVYVKIVKTTENPANVYMRVDGFQFSPGSKNMNFRPE